MTLSFPPTRPSTRAGAWHWRSRNQDRCAAQGRRSPAADFHETMEKLATADDIAAAVQAIRAASSA